MWFTRRRIALIVRRRYIMTTDGEVTATGIADEEIADEVSVPPRWTAVAEPGRHRSSVMTIEAEETAVAEETAEETVAAGDKLKLRIRFKKAGIKSVIARYAKLEVPE